MSYQNVSFGRLLLLVALLGYLGGQMLHETGHWAVLQLFGRGPVMSFTGLVQRDEPPAHPEEWAEFTAPDGELVWFHLTSLPDSRAEWLLMVAAGPLAQLVAMIAGLLVSRYAGREVIRGAGLILALINSFGPTLYQIRSTFSGAGGDEYFIAYLLNTPKYAITIPIALASALGFAVGMGELAGWRLRLKWLASLCIGLLAQGPLLMLANRVTQAQVNLGNPFFRPVFGFSLPVVVTNALALLALVVVMVGWDNSLSGQRL